MSRTPLLVLGICICALVATVFMQPSMESDSWDQAANGAASMAYHRVSPLTLLQKESRDNLEAEKENDEALLEAKKSKVVDLEASRDDEDAQIAESQAKVRNTETKIADMKRKIARENKQREKMEAKVNLVRQQANEDDATGQTLDERSLKERDLSPSFVSRVPSEENKEKALKKEAAKMRQRARLLGGQREELQQSTVATMQSAVHAEEKAQSQFSLAKEDDSRATSKLARAAADKKAVKMLSASLPALEKKEKAADIKFQVVRQEDKAARDKVHALLFKLDGLKKKLAVLKSKTQVSGRSALKDVEKGVILPGITTEQQKKMKKRSEESKALVEAVQEEMNNKDSSNHEHQWAKNDEAKRVLERQEANKVIHSLFERSSNKKKAAAPVTRTTTTQKKSSKPAKNILSGSFSQRMKALDKEAADASAQADLYHKEVQQGEDD